MSGKLILAVVALALISGPVLAKEHDASIFLQAFARKLLQTNGTGNSTGNGTDVTDAIQIWNAAGITASEFTILAPTNQAFMNTFAAAGIQMPANITDIFSNQTLAQYSTIVFENHLIPGLYNSQNITNGTAGNATLPTLLGTNLTVSNTNGNITFTMPETGATASVVQADIPFGTNIVHIVDGLLIPAATPNGTGNGTAGNGTTPAPTTGGAKLF